MGDAPALDPSKSGHHVPFAGTRPTQSKIHHPCNGYRKPNDPWQRSLLSVPRPSRGTLQKMQTTKTGNHNQTSRSRRRRPSGRRYTVEHSTPRTTATVRRDLDLTSDTTTPAARAANITCNRQPMTSDLHLMRQSDRARVRRTHAKTIIIERKPRHSTGKIAATTAARPTRHRQSK